MKCPHCDHELTDDDLTAEFTDDGQSIDIKANCTECGKCHYTFVEVEDLITSET